MLEHYLREATYPIVLTGAGMSTESGIPDFRSQENGRWLDKNPMVYSSSEGMNQYYEDFLPYQQNRIAEIHQVIPHEGYKILTNWQEKGIIKRILTQNVDGLHQKAHAKDVLELHGNLLEVRCMSCSSISSSLTYLQPNGDQCFCGGRVRPNVVLFGEPINDSILEEAMDELFQTDLLLVLGTSLQVQPVSSFVRDAKLNGATVILVNEDETPMMKYIDVHIDDIRIQEVLKITDYYLNHFT